MTAAFACGGSIQSSSDDTAGGTTSGGSDASTSSDGSTADASCTGSGDCKCGRATCIDGEWRCPKSCACPADLSGLDGTSCTGLDGVTCGGENCTDPCQFCNMVQCEFGVWHSIEAFPEPCVDGSVPDGG